MMSPRIPFLTWCLLSSIWGSTWLVIKLGVDTLPPFTFAFVRFLFATTALLALAFLRKKRLLFANRRETAFITSTALLYISINYALVYWSETRIDSGMAAVFYNLLILFGLAFAHFMLPDDRITSRKLTGALLGLAGVALLFYEQWAHVGAGAVQGAIAITIATALTALAGTITKRWGREYDPLSMTASQMVVGTVPLIGLGLLVEGNPFRHDWQPAHLAGAAYLGLIGTALSFGLLNWLYRHMAVTKTQLIPLASTVIAVWLGWLVRGETLTGIELLGTALVLAGLLQTTRPARRRFGRGAPPVERVP